MEIKSHLSGSDSRGYSVLNNGCSLSKGGLSKEDALAVARHYGLKIEWCWDGEIGQFIKIS